MRIAFLPNWCKYLSLVLFILSFIVDIEGAVKSFQEGYQAGLNSHNLFEELSSKDEYWSLASYLSDLLIILSIVTYILSKDKRDDEYINVMRGNSLLIALLIGTISCLIAYGFGCQMQAIWLLVILFLSYIITFKIMKIAADPWLKANEQD